jgi:hypothetical protein
MIDYIELQVLSKIHAVPTEIKDSELTKSLTFILINFKGVTIHQANTVLFNDMLLLKDFDTLLLEHSVFESCEAELATKCTKFNHVGERLNF